MPVKIKGFNRQSGARPVRRSPDRIGTEGGGIDAAYRQESRRSARLSARQSGNAFTLLEVLVVIGIIALLCALLLPGLGRAKAAARQVACRSRLHQLSLGLRMYVDAAQSRYPLFEWRDQGRRLFWTDLLADEVGSQPPARDSAAAAGAGTVYQCPSFRRGSGGAGAGQLEQIYYGYNGVGFAYLGLGGKGQIVDGALQTLPVTESEVAQPADMIALGDGIEGLPEGQLLAGGITLARSGLFVQEKVRGIGPGDLRRIDRAVRSVHAGRASVAFCDGHVTGERLRHLFEDRTAAGLRWWNRDHEPHPDWLLDDW